MLLVLCKQQMELRYGQIVHRNFLFFQALIVGKSKEVFAAGTYPVTAG